MSVSGKASNKDFQDPARALRVESGPASTGAMPSLQIVLNIICMLSALKIVVSMDVSKARSINWAQREFQTINFPFVFLLNLL